jgi:hypothetical protein
MPRSPKTSITQDRDSTLAERLRSARPRLIFRVEPQSDDQFEGAPFIVEIDTENDEVMDEGYDPQHSPPGCPVYWRIVKRRDGHFYYSIFQVPRDYVFKVWGTRGLSFCDPVTGSAVARIETRLPAENEENSSIN